jgi:hypothetical protein
MTVATVVEAPPVPTAQLPAGQPRYSWQKLC